MEVNKTFNFLKKTLSNLEKNLPYSLSELTGTSLDSKSYTSQVVTELKPYFGGKNVSELRSLHLLLLVNTKLNITNELEVDHNVGHVVGFTSTLSQYLYLVSVVHLNLFSFIKEVLEFAPIKLVLEVIDIISKETKYLTPCDACHIQEKVINGITSRIKFSDCDYTNRKLFEHFQSCMLYFKNEEKREEDDDDDDEDSKPDKEMLRLSGYKILSLLKIVHTLLKLSFNLEKSAEPIDLYEISLDVNVQRWYNTYDLMDKNDILMECLEVAYFKCRSFLYELDIQMYMEWHETEYEGTTLQTIVGEEAFYVCQLLKNNKNSEHLPKGIFELVEMLTGVSCEPKIKVEHDFEEKLGVDRLEELILGKEIDLHLLNAVKNFLKEEGNCFEFVITIKLIHKLCSEKKSSEIDSEAVKEAILLLLRKSELNDVASFLNDFLSEYGIKNVLSKPTVDLSEIIKNLNECYDDEESTSSEELTIKKKKETLMEALLLALQSPEFVLSTLIEQGILECNKQKGILEVLRILKQLCLFVPSSNETSASRAMLVDIIERFFRCKYCHLSPLEKQLFGTLIFSLSNDGLLNNDDFLTHCLLPLLNLKNDINWEITSDLLKLFREFYTSCVKETQLSMVILLIQLAQLLEQSRWSIDSFTSERLNACEEVIDLIHLFLKLYSENPGPEKDKHWLSMQLRGFSYLTKSYFPYLYEYNEPQNVETLFLSLIHGSSDVHTEFVKIDAQDPSSLILPISKIIISLTNRELQNIVSNYAVGNPQRIFFILNVLSDAIAFVCGAATQFSFLQSGDNNPIFNCLGHIINNYLIVLQVNIVKCSSTDDQANYIKCINRIAATLKSFPKHLLRTYQFNVVKVVNEILPKLEEKSNDFDGDARQLLLGLFLM